MKDSSLPAVCSRSTVKKAPPPLRKENRYNRSARPAYSYEYCYEIYMAVLPGDIPGCWYTGITRVTGKIYQAPIVHVRIPCVSAGGAMY